ncbi:MAG: F0F1 ATP synthase subunit delta, partial [Pseudomonadota bacterium]
ILYNKQKNILETQVISYNKLSIKQIQNIEQTLTSYMKKNIVIEQKIDKSILGGVVIKLGTYMFDYSIKEKLNQFGIVTRKTVNAI